MAKNATEEKTRLLALAHLKLDKKPKEVAELLDIAYAKVVRWRKELEEAERRDAIADLFNLDEATLETVLEAAKNELEPHALQLTDKEVLEGELQSIKEGVKSGQLLEAELSEAATTLTKRISVLAAGATQAETVVMLAKALSDIQTSFFAKGTNVQVNNFGGNNFEEFLRD